jgi:lipid II:glycine glycyltransferase (peptidoglycan interpeptide bridge formation enzyme)
MQRDNSTMSSPKIRALSALYSCEIDIATEQTWSELVLTFDDANIYQTWQHGAVVAGHRNLSRVVVKHDGSVVAMALVRVKKMPVLGVGVAYVFWGPLWRQKGDAPNAEHFRQAVRALRNEFVCKRGMTLWILPLLIDDGSPIYNAILAEEGLLPTEEATRGRTILMDLGQPLSIIREGMASHWKRELKVAEKNKLQIVEGTSGELFDRFIEMYKEMVSRKKFVEPNDIYQFKEIQSRLPEALKMKVLLCESSAGLCAGAIYSLIGNSAVYLFGATSSAGMKSRGSYFLQWRILEELKQQDAMIYNLNGINPTVNPGTYKFKNDLAGTCGRDVFYVGRFDAYPNGLSSFMIRLASSIRKARRTVDKKLKAGSPTNAEKHHEVEKPTRPTPTAKEIETVDA